MKYHISELQINNKHFKRNDLEGNIKTKKKTIENIYVLVLGLGFGRF